jgi:hypothetical protein
MNDKKCKTQSQMIDYTEQNQNKRLLADYIRTSIWDEKMNQIREYWLWERSGIYPKKPEHY